MENTLIYVFDDCGLAERVREELIALEFRHEHVVLTVGDDEAGPVAGNFSVGNDPSVTGGTDYQEAYANPKERGTCTLTITPLDATQSETAIRLLAHYGIIEQSQELGAERAARIEQGAAAERAERERRT
ncbi:hypothetical protein [Massilia horti]|uniref:Uncharacterized protein n=1 Tax=Massilia horti TaxID=2562153 RepID=A0A4Y9T3P3_9BURK|nr:hypothetical protein [Massilia horti]TFW34825.1 hypothetical protein E4O92_03035 [Massilia horti]